MNAATEGDLAGMKKVIAEPKEEAMMFSDPVALERLKTDKLVDEADHSGTTPLMAAAYKGHVQAVKLLLAEEANVELQDAGGYTALRHACLMRTTEHATIVELLLEAHAMPDNGDAIGCTALHTVAASGNTQVMKLLLDALADADRGGVVASPH